MCGGILRLVVAVVLAEVEVFAGKHSLCSYKVRIHTLPTSRQRTAMEYDHQPVVVSIRKYVFIQAHCLLLVAAEEIHLYAFHSYLSEPSHLTLSHDSIIHEIYRSLLNVVPVAARTVPEEHIDTIAISISDKAFQSVTPDILIPPVVYKHVFIAHGLSKTDVFHLVVIVD